VEKQANVLRFFSLLLLLLLRSRTPKKRKWRKLNEYSINRESEYSSEYAQSFLVGRALKIFLKSLRKL
jgi:VanZ family protein